MASIIVIDRVWLTEAVLVDDGGLGAGAGPIPAVNGSWSSAI
jgi:hypothetical protein